MLETKLANGMHQIAIDTPGLFQVIIQNGLCMDTCSFEVTATECTIDGGLQDKYHIQTTAPTSCQPSSGKILLEIDPLFTIGLNPTDLLHSSVEYSELSEGSYIIYGKETSSECLYVLDTIGLQLQIVPTDLRISIDQKLDPTCNDDEDGLLRIRPTGGTSPYDIIWNTGQQTNQIERLSEGTYQVTVSDLHGCQYRESFTLSSGSMLNLPWPYEKDIELCLGSEIQVDIPDHLQAEWSKDNQVFSNANQLSIAKEGQYSVIAWDSIGCEIKKEINLSYSPSTFIPNMLIPSVVPKDSLIIFLENSWPAPDSIDWILPFESELIQKYLNQVIVRFPNLGDYSIGLMAETEHCVSTIFKTISVVDTLTSTNSSQFTFSGIQDIQILPNPNSGTFDLIVKQSKPSTLQVRIYSEIGDLVYEEQLSGGTEIRHRIGVPDLSAGFYSLLCQNQNSWKKAGFILNR